MARFASSVVVVVVFGMVEGLASGTVRQVCTYRYVGGKVGMFTGVVPPTGQSKEICRQGMLGIYLPPTLPRYLVSLFTPLLHTTTGLRHDL